VQGRKSCEEVYLGLGILVAIMVLLVEHMQVEV
jgi:hypothetical protein